MTCSVCYGCRWVCENHLDKPWGDLGENLPNECACGAGSPCPNCNRGSPPEWAPGTVETWHRDKGWIH